MGAAASLQLSNMAAHLSALLILAGLTGLDGVKTVRKVSVIRGGSVSVPCLYESTYKHHVKYLCEGRSRSECLYAVKTNKPARSGKFSISDDKQGIFTVTFRDLMVDQYYWCAVEINNGDDCRLFQLSVTSGRSLLFVDHQEVTGFIGEDVTVHCHYSVGGEGRWCRLGGLCVKEPSGSIEGTRVTISVEVPGLFSVTLSGLTTRSSGWFFCDHGGLQMPVHVTVTQRPGTANTEQEPVTNSSVYEFNDFFKFTTAEAESHSSAFHLKIFYIRHSLGILMVLVGSFTFYFFRRRKATATQSSAAASVRY